MILNLTAIGVWRTSSQDWKRLRIFRWFAGAGTALGEAV